MTHILERSKYFTTSTKWVELGGLTRKVKATVFSDPDARGEGFSPGDVGEVSINGKYMDMNLLRKDTDTFKKILVAFDV